MADTRGFDIMLALQAPAFVSVESSSTSSGPLNFIQSQEGGSIAVFEFYKYVKNRNLTGDRTYWTCLNCTNSTIVSRDVYCQL